MWQKNITQKEAEKNVNTFNAYDQYFLSPQLRDKGPDCKKTKVKLKIE